MPSTIPTRFLILSDTHGRDFLPEDLPHQRTDVVLHCGDLTDGSKLDEYRSALSMLKNLSTPLKLVIPGNHDFTLDLPAFETKLSEASIPLDPALVAREYGHPGQARQLFSDARSAGIHLLDEGTHSFTLANGARLKLYASSYTPALGAWGFQYPPDQGRHFAIEADTDIVMTHGPPKGIMDMTRCRERAGCPDLFAAVSQAKPKIHCFGHIHEGWGARAVTWKDSGLDRPSHFTAIDNERSHVVESLSSLRPNPTLDSNDRAEEKRAKREQLARDRCAMAGSVDDGQTLFVSAAIIGHDEDFMQRPWLVEVELPRCTEFRQESVA